MVGPFEGNLNCTGCNLYFEVLAKNWSSYPSILWNLQRVVPMSKSVLYTQRTIDEQDADVQMLLQAGFALKAQASLNAPAAQEDISGASGLIVGLNIVDGELLDRMSNIKVVSRMGVGYDNIDLDAATARGVQVTYVPDYGVHEVSTHAITMLLAMARNMPTLLAASAAGRWDYKAMGTVHRIQSQTLGVAGFGRIGRETALKGKGLGMKVIVHDPVVAASQIEAHGLAAVDFPSLLRCSDYISLHVPSMPATRHMIDAAALKQMKNTARIINTARGPLVDEDALLAALRAGEIDAAALDVFHEEPPQPDHPLLHEPNVHVTPHAAWYSEEAKVDMRTSCARDVINVLTGQPPAYPLNEV